MSRVWCNGVFSSNSEAKIAISDRGFTLADGIFETLRAVGRTPLWFAEHMARLRASADDLGLAIAFDDETIQAAIENLLETEGFPESAVRITLTRGPSKARGLWSSDNPGMPTLLVTVAPAGGIVGRQKMIICRVTRRNEKSPLSRIKSLNYGDSILARREALSKGADDALLLNTQGNLACACVGNVFVRIAGRWLTPRLADGILPGLARAKILQNIRAEERGLSESDLEKADAAFVSNSLGCVILTEIDKRALSAIADEALPLGIYRNVD